MKPSTPITCKELTGKFPARACAARALKMHDAMFAKESPVYPVCAKCPLGKRAARLLQEQGWEPEQLRGRARQDAWDARRRYYAERIRSMGNE